MSENKSFIDQVFDSNIREWVYICIFIKNNLVFCTALDLNITKDEPLDAY